MSGPRERAADLARFYTVTEPQRHPRGYTVYKVTARVVSRRNPEDVQEIIVWKRYSDFKKLHKELWQIHKNLFRHPELFPPFAKGTVFGRFDANVIEERRQRAEDLLQFSAGIPALCHSRQLEAFFEGGIIHDGSELIGPAEGFSDSHVDSSATGSTEGFSSDSDLVSLTVDVDSLAELGDGMASRQSSPVRACSPSVSSDSAAPGAATSDGEPSRTDADRGSHSLLVGSLRHKLGKRDYLEKAGELIKLALKKEEEEDYEAASDFYRKGVDLLLEGVQGESSPSRREAVKRRTAEYLLRAESISSLPRKPQRDDLSQPPGALSSRPSWSLRSPAEELKAFRVLGVIDKVLLVVDTRTEQTFILKGLRRSSECSGSRRTVIPRRVPNMVCLHKYIISEESVFLVLQPVEGGKLWSHISKFLSRSPEESPDPQGVQASTLQKAPLHLPTRIPQDGSSIESRGSDGASTLRVLPVKTSLTPSSQEDGTQEDESQDSSPKWPDSGSSSEEECTTSYLTLCNEYGQEKIAPGSLTEEPFMKTEDTRALQGSPVPLAADHGSPSAHLGSLALNFLPGDETPEAGGSPRTADSFSRSRNSPMEFFRIDSEDSTSEQLGLEFEEKLYSLKPEPLNPFFAFGDGESTRRAVSAGEGRAPFRAQDAKCRGSGDLVPVISFREAAVGDVGGSEEGRPDLLVNLPGELEPGREAAAPGPAECAQTGAGLAESTLLGAPDVLCLRLSPEPGQPCGETGTEGLSEPHGSRSHSGPGKCYTQAELGTFFVAGGHHGFSGEASWLRSPHPKFQGLGVVGLALAADSTEEGLSQLSDPSSGASKSHSDTDTFSTEEVLLFTDQADDPTGEEPAFLSRGGLVPAGTCGRAPEEDRRIRQLFEDLDRRLALSSRLQIPEAWVQRWAAEMVVALDALHREGIVCRDLNPNNILLNDRGHIQLTYFSRWSEVEDSCDNEAVERMYCAPEVGAVTEETESCDWWSLGAVLFELLTGETLAECHPAGINTHTILNVPECVSEEARSLIQQLLQFNPVERLGAGVAGVEDIKSHPFFNSVDWAALTR